MFDPIMYAMMKKNGGGLPVVEFENADGTLSENDQANLTAAIGNPIVLKFPGANGIGIASLAAYDCSGGYHQFVCLYPQMIFRSTDGTTWEVIA